MNDDLISRQAAIDVVDKYNFDFPIYMDGFVTKLRDAMKEDLKDDIKDLPSAQPEQRWIPCSDRPPKVCEDVMIMFEKNMAVGFYSHGDWNVNTGNGYYIGLTDSEDQPIAWQPLPEPYKADMNNL